MAIQWKDRYSTRAKGMTASEIRELLKVVNQEGIISFAGGIPAAEFFPYEELEDAYHGIFRDIKRRGEALQYGISEGYLPLRESIADDLRQQGLTLDASNVFITNGSQQGLDFLGKLFINEGNPIAVESPSYLGAFQAFSAYRPAYLSISTDLDGMRVEEAEPVFRQKPAFLYIMPNFQNPRGVTLSLERRHQLVELAQRYGIPVLEDDAYGQLYYEAQPLPSLFKLDALTQGGDIEKVNTIYMGTFSKVLAPGLRVAWIAAPHAVIERLVLLKQAGDLHTSSINQMVVYDALQQQFFPEHVRRLRQVYKARRDAMLAALEKYFPPGIEWTHPKGGMFLWLTLPSDINGKALLEEALQYKVAFVPGEAFFADRSGTNTIRLNFSMMTPEKIEEGIARLGKLLSEKVAQPEP